MPSEPQASASLGKPSKYDRQLIIVLGSGDAEPDLLAQARALESKQREVALASEIVVLAPEDVAAEGAKTASLAELEAAIDGRRTVAQPLTTRSRVYLIGRGEWPLPRLSGWSANRLARVLIAAGLPAVRVLSIVADEAGRDSDTEPDQAPHRLDSLAAGLHRALHEQGNLDTVVHARVLPVQVVLDGRLGAGMQGRKLTLDPAREAEPGQHHRPHSKLRFSWDGPVQTWAWTD